jgi:hypothetical protein
MAEVTLKSLDTKISGIGREIGDIKKALNGNGQPGLIRDVTSLGVRVTQCETGIKSQQKHCDRTHGSTPESREANTSNKLTTIAIIMSTITGILAVIVAIVK